MSWGVLPDKRAATMADASRERDGEVRPIDRGTERCTPLGWVISSRGANLAPSGSGEMRPVDCGGRIMGRSGLSPRRRRSGLRPRCGLGVLHLGLPPIVALGEPGGRQGGEAGLSLIESFQGGDMLALPA
jgi:hypothetical protein